MSNISLFVFHRALRLKDNTGLIEALKKSDKVVPIFIFTPEQLVRNPYKSDNCVQFMMESLEELDQELRDKKSKLYYFYGKQDVIISRLIKKLNITAVYLNLDYTPYALDRDKKIKRVCDRENIEFFCYEDHLLNPVGSIRTGGGDICRKFTPYFNAAKKQKIRDVVDNRRTNYYRGKIVGEYKGSLDRFYKENKSIAHHGGRENALKILNKISKFKNYNKTRDILNIQTTRLSAYIKFGCVSIREVYHKFKSVLGSRNELIKQLYWRDFYYNITYYYPETLRGKNFNKKYNKVPWIRKQNKYFTLWKKGMTGFPIVDAAMREMNNTGFMHNRGRLIVASFLTKNLMWHWVEGEKYFAQNLVDYDPSVNNGNWQWVSGSGVDSQPYFRIFNPWSQSEKYDRDAKYIKEWIPELRDIPAKHIHQWYDYYQDYDTKYPEPMISHDKSRETAIKKYKKALK